MHLSDAMTGVGVLMLGWMIQAAATRPGTFEACRTRLRLQGQILPRRRLPLISHCWGSEMNAMARAVAPVIGLGRWLWSQTGPVTEADCFPPVPSGQWGEGNRSKLAGESFHNLVAAG